MINDNIVKATTVEELKKSPGYPSENRFRKGMVAVIECDQEIPCNPCEDICPFKAIIIGTPITQLPVMNDELCTGCGSCVAGCPGQAIFMVNKVYSQEEDLVGIPYEYIPVPQKGDQVDVANRDGDVLGKGTIVKVVNTKANNRTNVVYVAVQKGLGDEVRAIVCQ